MDHEISPGDRQMTEHEVERLAQLMLELERAVDRLSVVIIMCAAAIAVAFFWVA